MLGHHPLLLPFSLPIWEQPRNACRSVAPSGTRIMPEVGTTMLSGLGWSPGGHYLCDFDPGSTIALRLDDSIFHPRSGQHIGPTLQSRASHCLCWYGSRCLSSGCLGQRMSGSSSHSPTCLLLDDGPVLIAVDVLLQAGAELHVADVVQKDVDDGPRPAAHFRGRQELTELKMGHSTRSGEAREVVGQVPKT